MTADASSRMAGITLFFVGFHIGFKLKIQIDTGQKPLNYSNLKGAIKFFLMLFTPRVR